MAPRRRGVRVPTARPRGPPTATPAALRWVPTVVGGFRVTCRSFWYVSLCFRHTQSWKAGAGQPKVCGRASSGSGGAVGRGGPAGHTATAPAGRLGRTGAQAPGPGDAAGGRGDRPPSERRLREADGGLTGKAARWGWADADARRAARPRTTAGGR